MSEINFDRLAEELSKGWHFTMHITGTRRGKTREKAWLDEYTLRRIYEYLFGRTDTKRVHQPNALHFSLKMPYGYWTTDHLFKAELGGLVEKFERMKADFLVRLRDPKTYKRLMELSEEFDISPEELIKSIRFKILPVRYKILETTEAYRNEIVERFKSSILKRLRKAAESLSRCLGTTKSARTQRIRRWYRDWTYLKQLNVVNWRREEMRLLERVMDAVARRSKKTFPYDEVEAWIKKEEDLRLKVELQKLLDRARSPVAWKL